MFVDTVLPGPIGLGTPQPDLVTIGLYNYSLVNKRMAPTSSLISTIENSLHPLSFPHYIDAVV